MSFYSVMKYIPAAVQNDSVRLQAYELVLHRNIMKPGEFGIHDERVWYPEFVYKAAVQTQSFICVVVGQTIISPALTQKHSHGVFLKTQYTVIMYCIKNIMKRLFSIECV